MCTLMIDTLDTIPIKARDECSFLVHTVQAYTFYAPHLEVLYFSPQN